MVQDLSNWPRSNPVMLVEMLDELAAAVERAPCGATTQGQSAPHPVVWVAAVRNNAIAAQRDQKSGIPDGSPGAELEEVALRHLPPFVSRDWVALLPSAAPGSKVHRLYGSIHSSPRTQHACF